MNVWVYLSIFFVNLPVYCSKHTFGFHCQYLPHSTKFSLQSILIQFYNIYSFTSSIYTSLTRLAFVELNPPLMHTFHTCILNTQIRTWMLFKLQMHTNENQQKMGAYPPGLIVPEIMLFILHCRLKIIIS